MNDIKEIIRVLGFIQEYFGNHADEQEPDSRKELFRDWSEITLDTITLLKAQEQEPHVLPLEELQSIGETWDKNTPPYIWVEILDAPEWYTDDKMWVSYSFVRDTIKIGSEKYNKDNYMKRWRCWNKKPTDDQLKNTPFNESD